MATKDEFSKIGKSNVRRGKNHERRLANLLKEWSGVDFRRRRVEGRESNVIDRESTADIIPVNGLLWFSIEAKCGEPSTFDNILSNPVGCKFSAWWHQTQYDAMLLSKCLGYRVLPLLFFKPHPNFDWIAISRYAFDTDGPLAGSNLYNNKSFPHIRFDYYEIAGEISHNIVHTKKKQNKVLFPLKLDPVVFIRWRDFKDRVDPKLFFKEYPTIVEKPTVEPTDQVAP